MRIQKRGAGLCAAGLLAFGMPAPVAAQTGSTAQQTFRVDDTGTIVLDPFLKMQWQQIGRVGASNIVSATTRVSVSLNLSPWTGRSGRIFMSLPRTSGPSVRATWTTGGSLLPGTLISGDRALVYAGPINAAFLRDLIDMKLEADGTRLVGTEALAFGFEIEVDQ